MDELVNQKINVTLKDRSKLQADIESKLREYFPAVPDTAIESRAAAFEADAYVRASSPAEYLEIIGTGVSNLETAAKRKAEARKTIGERQVLPSLAHLQAQGIPSQQTSPQPYGQIPTNPNFKGLQTHQMLQQSHAASPQRLAGQKHICTEQELSPNPAAAVYQAEDISAKMFDEQLVSLSPSIHGRDMQALIVRETCRTTREGEENARTHGLNGSYLRGSTPGMTFAPLQNGNSSEALVNNPLIMTPQRPSLELSCPHDRILAHEFEDERSSRQPLLDKLQGSECYARQRSSGTLDFRHSEQNCQQHHGQDRSRHPSCSLQPSQMSAAHERNNMRSAERRNTNTDALARFRHSDNQRAAEVAAILALAAYRGIPFTGEQARSLTSDQIHQIIVAANQRDDLPVADGALKANSDAASRNARTDATSRTYELSNTAVDVLSQQQTPHRRLQQPAVNDLLALAVGLQTESHLESRTGGLCDAAATAMPEGAAQPTMMIRPMISDNIYAEKEQVPGNEGHTCAGGLQQADGSNSLRPLPNDADVHVTPLPYRGLSLGTCARSENCTDDITAVQKESEKVLAKLMDFRAKWRYAVVILLPTICRLRERQDPSKRQQFCKHLRTSVHYLTVHSPETIISSLSIAELDQTELFTRQIVAAYTSLYKEGVDNWEEDTGKRDMQHKWLVKSIECSETTRTTHDGRLAPIPIARCYGDSQHRGGPVAQFLGSQDHHSQISQHPELNAHHQRQLQFVQWRQQQVGLLKAQRQAKSASKDEHLPCVSGEEANEARSQKLGRSEQNLGTTFDAEQQTLVPFSIQKGRILSAEAHIRSSQELNSFDSVLGIASSPVDNGFLTTTRRKRDPESKSRPKSLRDGKCNDVLDKVAEKKRHIGNRSNVCSRSELKAAATPNDPAARGLLASRDTHDIPELNTRDGHGARTDDSLLAAKNGLATKTGAPAANVMSGTRSNSDSEAQVLVQQSGAERMQFCQLDHVPRYTGAQTQPPSLTHASSVAPAQMPAAMNGYGPMPYMKLQSTQLRAHQQLRQHPTDRTLAQSASALKTILPRQTPEQMRRDPQQRLQMLRHLQAQQAQARAHLPTTGGGQRAEPTAARGTKRAADQSQNGACAKIARQSGPSGVQAQLCDPSSVQDAAQKWSITESAAREAVQMTQIWQAQTEAELRQHKKQRIYDTLAVLRKTPSIVAAQAKIHAGMRQQFAGVDKGNDGDKNGVIQSKEVFECSTSQGVRLSEKTDHGLIDTNRVQEYVAAECRAVVQRFPALKLKEEVVFNTPVVTCRLRSHGIMLPELEVRAQRGYPFKGGITYGFRRLPVGWVPVLKEIRSQFYKQLAETGASSVGVGVLLEAWVHAAASVIGGATGGGQAVE